MSVQIYYTKGFLKLCQKAMEHSYTVMSLHRMSLAGHASSVLKQGGKKRAATNEGTDLRTYVIPIFWQ